MSKQTILIDIRETSNLKSGGKAVYNLCLTRELVKNLNYNFVLVTNQETTDFVASENVKVQVLPGKGLLWHFKLRKLILENRPDFFLAMTSFLTPYLIKDQSVKTYILIHDLICFLHSEGHPLKAKLMETYFLPQIVDKVSGIFTVSENTKKDLKLLFPHLDESKIKLAPCGYTKNSIPANNQQVQSKPYILSVSTLLPRKNFEVLIEAFNNLKDSYQGDLIIIGNPASKSYFKKLQNLTNSYNLQDRVIFKGFVTNQELANYYAYADLFVYPSKYEGFGIPLLEAMSYQCAVLAANSSSLPEVGKSAAIYFDPTDATDLTLKIQEFLNNPEIKTQLELLAQDRLSAFSWQKTAEQVISSIQKV